MRYIKAICAGFYDIRVGAERTYTVLPDTGVVMGFQFRGRLSRMEGNAETRLAASGVTGYETFVADGHTVFYGKQDFITRSEPKYAPLTVAGKSDRLQFQKDLKEHQQGKTDYLTFCRISANYGVEKWVVDIARMTCTYFDKAGNEMLVEQVPSTGSGTAGT